MARAGQDLANWRFENDSSGDSSVHFFYLCDAYVVGFIQPCHQAQQLSAQSEIGEIKLTPRTFVPIQLDVEVYYHAAVENRVCIADMNVLELPEIDSLE